MGCHCDDHELDHNRGVSREAQLAIDDSIMVGFIRDRACRSRGGGVPGGQGSTQGQISSSEQRAAELSGPVNAKGRP